VLILGGTGFIGYHATLELLGRGQTVTCVGLPPGPGPGVFPAETRFSLLDFDRLPDDKALALVSGHDAVVFCAGADDRALPRAPAVDFFRARNVAAAGRFFGLAARAGVKRGVLVGSYFTHFCRTRPEWQLAESHPYIRSRVEQADAALAACEGRLSLAILELPWVFGSMPGTRPLWTPLVRYVGRTPVLFFTRGGTAMTSVGLVAQAVASALERGVHGAAYTIVERNLTWAELLGRISELTGRKKRVVALPPGVVRPGAALLRLSHRLKGRESGLDPVEFVRFQLAETFVDPQPARAALGLAAGDFDSALANAVRAALARKPVSPA